MYTAYYSLSDIMVTMLSTISVIQRYDSRSGQTTEYKSILHAALVALTKNYKYPTELVGLLKHR